MSKVLLTGGLGFIGLNLQKRLSKFDCLSYDSLSEQIHGQTPTFDSSLPYIRGDIRNFDELLAAINRFKPTTVIHLASETGTGQSYFHPQLHTDVNVTGTASLLAALDKSNTSLEYFLLTSSRAIYGEGPYLDKTGSIVYPLGRTKEMFSNRNWDFNGLSVIPASSSITAANPCNVYGVTKFTQENLIKIWCHEKSVPLGIARLQNVYGPGQSPNNPYTGVVNNFIQQIRKKSFINVFEDGKISRDFIYIDDVTDFLADLLLERKNGIFDVGFGHSTTILNLAEIITNNLKSDEPFISGDFRYGDVRHVQCNSAIADRNRVDINSGLDKVIPWVLNNS